MEKLDENISVKINNLGKEYRLGAIGGGTLRGDLTTWWAKVRGKENPNAIIGEDSSFDHYGERFWALKDINLEVYKGEAVGIIGHNGAGKSTLLKILSRVTAPTTGDAVLNGRVSSMLEVGTGFHPELSGRDNIYMNGAILGMTKKEVDAKIEEIIDFSECRQFIDTPVKRYSSGMYVKLAFAVAAHLDAEIMIMDEVLAVGDVKFQQKCLGKMDGAAHQDGKTVLYVSHNMATIRQLCNRCIVLDHGRIVFDGEVERAIEHYIGLSDSKKKSFVDFTESRRPAGFGKAFKINSIEFLDKKDAVFLDNEPVKFTLDYSAEKEFDDIYVRFEVENMDSSPVGMAESVSLGKIVPCENKKATFSWDISNIVPGKYHITVDAYIKNEFGTYFSYDHPFDKLLIEIVQDLSDGDNKSAWDRKYWNSIRLNTMVCSGEYL